MLRFILLSGKKRSGKNTAASLLRSIYEERRLNVQEYAFAEPIKKLCSEIFCIDRMNFEDKKEEKSFVSSKHLSEDIRKSVGINDEFLTHRQILQVVGTEFFRKQIDPDIWAKIPFLTNWGLYTDIVIIPDLRFLNEIEIAKQFNSTIIRINRNNVLGDEHISEKQLDNYDKFDYVIDNNGTIEDLKQKLMETL